VGDQTLLRLLAGLRDQLEHHDKTGVQPPIRGGELFTIDDGKIADSRLHGDTFRAADHADVVTIERDSP
jgi:hypothetical protein